jgi:hypothetical protein
VSRRRVPSQQSSAAAPHSPFSPLHVASPPPAVRLEHVSHVLPSVAVVGSLNPYSGVLNWHVSSLIMPLTCRLDGLLVGFVQNCRRQTRAKAICQILGPTELDVQSLFRDNDGQGQVACSPHLITDLTRNHLNAVGMARLMERIAIFAPVTPETQPRSPSPNPCTGT